MSTVAAGTAQATPASKPRWRDILASPKMVAIMVLGAASGFPNQITESALQAWLKDSGASNTTIGILSYVALPYLLKFLWAPAIDRYPLPFLGRRRGWIALMQLCLAVAIGVFALQNPTVSLTPIAVCAVAIVFFSATQDIAIDAYRTDVSQPHERGLAAAANNLGYRTSAYIASAFALVMADWAGWKPAFLILGVVMAAFCLGTLLAPEPHYEHQPPRSLKESLVVPLRELLGTPSAIAFIALVILFKVGDAFALRLFTPFMMDVGFTKTEIALVLKALFTASGVIGAILGGVAMVRLGLLKSMLIFGAVQAASNFLYYAMALTGKNYALMIVAVGVDNIAGAMGNIASVALIMALCDVRYSAFQYALLSAIALTPRYLLGGPAGWIADNAGWPMYYVISVLLAMPGLLLVWLMRQKIIQLDQPRA
ncbi:AmpG family muropeptide MFS transporter [Steroidobacter cummioxidans]|uniref:AmpG family muropeptide MFS transporter n=1 Tax=Steroidobacter cummioxidans TaxID=1803913 RepID=UPI000E31B80C|nr:MFS transporter [Steroidobacter cummioxidans]